VFQTELGHRPVDLAVRHRRIECVNYLMMAETASSVGSSFDGCLKEFQSLQDQHEALRSLFRYGIRELHVQFEGTQHTRSRRKFSLMIIAR